MSESKKSARRVKPAKSRKVKKHQQGCITTVDRFLDVVKKGSVVALCVFDNEDDFDKWVSDYASFEKYMEAGDDWLEFFESRGNTVVQIIFNEAEYLEFLAAEGFRPRNAEEHSLARAKWVSSVISDSDKFRAHFDRQAEQLYRELKGLRNSVGCDSGLKKDNAFVLLSGRGLSSSGPHRRRVELRP